MSESRTIRIATQVHGRIILREAMRATDATEAAAATVLAESAESPELAESSAPLLVGFHGYGQNGENFLEAICEIPGISEWHVVSIQALHAFYDKRGTVVAGWMTSQDRHLAISDNIAYVTRALDEVGKHLVHRRPTVFLGFSQGTAMAYRAACLSGPGHGCDALIALGGDAPSEIETASVQTDPPRVIPRVLIGRGTNDTWYDEHKLERDVDRLMRMGSTVETCVFDGGHEWTDAFRTAAGDFLRELSRVSTHTV